MRNDGRYLPHDTAKYHCSVTNRAQLWLYIWKKGSSLILIAVHILYSCVYHQHQKCFSRCSRKPSRDSCPVTCWQRRIGIPSGDRTIRILYKTQLPNMTCRNGALEILTTHRDVNSWCLLQRYSYEVLHACIVKRDGLGVWIVFAAAVAAAAVLIKFLRPFSILLFFWHSCQVSPPSSHQLSPTSI